MPDQTEIDSEKKFQEPLKNRWEVISKLDKIAEKAGLKNINWERPISKADIDYILEHWPFLQMAKPDATEQDKHAVEFFTAMSGWLIHDYGDMIASSPGLYLFAGGYYYIDWESEDGSGGGALGELSRRGIVNPDKGTIINQMFLTGTDMVNLAIHRKWTGIHIIGGNRRIQWAAWIQATKYKLAVTGFTPTEEEIQKAKRLEISREELEQSLKQKRQELS